MSLPIFEPTTGWAVVIDAAIWAVSGVAAGWLMGRRAVDRFTHDNRITRLSKLEDGGRLYRRIGLHLWKDRLPEAGGFAGGMSKRKLPGTDSTALARFAAETRRAELTHWLAMTPILVFPLWNPWWLVGVMALYALAANLPCILVQRYNRARIERMLVHLDRDHGRHRR
jgi:glycosyl-4,4'-diaponeurosporenoate acyltransferase